LKNVSEPGLPAPMSKTNQVKKAELDTKKRSTRAHEDEPKTESTKSPLSDDPDEETVEEATPAMDITMEETKRILQDFIYLSLKGPAFAGTPRPGSTSQTP